ncbi:MAG: glycosyltransferase family A protein [Anaerolineae bacterium]
MPEVTVIIPTYNRPELLRRAIASVVAQTFEEWEAIIVDDGSPMEVASTVAAFGDSRLRYIRQENSGPSVARNRGLEHANGEYVAFLDDDDMFLPHKLELQVEVMRRQSACDVVLGGYRIVDPEGRLLKEEQPWGHHNPNEVKTWLLGCPTIPSVPLIRTQALADCGGFDTMLDRPEDWDLFLRLARDGRHMAFVESVVAVYSIGAAGRAQDARCVRDGMLYILEGFFASSRTQVLWGSLEAEARCRVYLTSSLHLYGLGDFSDAQDDLVLAHQALDLVAKPDIFIRAVRNQALNAATHDPIAFTRTIFQNLPPSLVMLRQYEQHTLGMVARSQLFEGQQRADRRLMRQALQDVLRYNPGLLADRGVLSVAAEVGLGPRAATILRSLI